MTVRCPVRFGNGRRAWLRLCAVFGIALAVPGCAVKGYDLGWRVEDRFAPLLGTPLDSASGCRWVRGRDVSDGCRALLSDLDRVLAGTRLQAGQPGLSCRGSVCSYRNAFQRRDIGLALILPVYRKITVREVRARFERTDGRWQVAELVVLDAPPPTYGPVRIGG
jgi:hypothetical protein